MLVPPPPLLNGMILPSGQRPGDIVQLLPGPINCGGGSVSPLDLERPFTTSTQRFGPDNPDSLPSYSLSFAIDVNGRAVDIESSPVIYAGFFIDTSDLAPSLAASRFPAGAPRQSCKISYSASLISVPTAPMTLLYEAASAPATGSAQTEIFARLGEEGDCARGPGSPRRLNYPEFEAISQPAGTRSWSFLRFDVDVAGRTRDVRVVGSSGNVALDAASVKALRGNRYAPGKASQGCIFHFYRLGNTPVEAPAIPADAPKDNGELPACIIDPKTITTLLNGNAYPTAFAARRIEGYAIVGFDTAPWGGIGNAKVLASEPDAAFGLAALQAVFNAKVPESEVGHRGCVRRILFRLPKEKPAG